MGIIENRKLCPLKQIKKEKTRVSLHVVQKKQYSENLLFFKNYKIKF